jgi:thymidine kinase
VRDYGYALDIVFPNSGWIEAICGPMFSGKTEELIRRLKRSMIARRSVQVFKPRIDNRYSGPEIVTHCNLRMPSESIDSVGEIIDRLASETQVIGIDEAHFFGEPLAEIATQLADSGVQVIVAGLDTDYMGRPFAPMPDLLALAESITKTLAICMRCGAPAKHTQRLVESEELIFVGTVDSYEARCRHCFEPGIPRQELLPFASPGRKKTSASD